MPFFIPTTIVQKRQKQTPQKYNNPTQSTPKKTQKNSNNPTKHHITIFCTIFAIKYISI